MENEGFKEIFRGVWIEESTAKPFSSRYLVRRVGEGGSETRYDGPLKELKTNKKGYYQVRHEGKTHIWHRLVYEYFKGPIPEGMIVDHIDNKRVWDNRIENLQILTQKENVRKALKSKRNTSGYTGVCWNKTANKWHAQIQVNGKNIYLGLFTCPHQAFLCFTTNKIKYHGIESINPIMEQILKCSKILGVSPFLELGIKVSEKLSEGL